MNSALVPNRTAVDGRAARAAASVARGWVGWYAGLVGTEAAERRRAEIESDLWEQQADARETGRRSSAVAASIAWRVVGGVPDDLLWVRTQRLTMRGLQADRKAIPVNNLGNSLARWWWVAGAAVLAAFYLSAGIDNLVAEPQPRLASAVQCFVYLAIVVTGIACSRKAPRTSGALIAMGSLPTLMLWWSLPLQVFGGAIALGALVQVARFSARGFAPRAGAVLGTLLLGVAVMAPVASTIPGIWGTPLFYTGLAVASLAAGIVLLVVTRVRTPEPTEAPRAPTLVA